MTSDGTSTDIQTLPRDGQAAELDVTVAVFQIGSGPHPIYSCVYDGDGDDDE